MITNLLSAIPYVGCSLVSWLWGGFAIDTPTLTRFFTLHFLIPFVVSAFSLIHVFLLHHSGSNNPLGITRIQDAVPFHWYYSSKDIFGFVVLLSSLLILVFFFPQLLSEADNFIPANPLTTPAHIVPE